MGCKGGLMDDAFDYVLTKQHGAIDTESAYPYTGRSGTCHYQSAKSGATLGGWTDIEAGDEDALLDAVATVGPVSIAVDASIGWQLYFGGVPIAGAPTLGPLRRATLLVQRVRSSLCAACAQLVRSLCAACAQLVRSLCAACAACSPVQRARALALADHAPDALLLQPEEDGPRRRHRRLRHRERQGLLGGP